MDEGQDNNYTGIHRLAASEIGETDVIISGYMPLYDYINIALVRDRQIVLTKSYGRNRLDEIDSYASVSKPVTSIILLQLLERGVISSLDDEIGRYSPKYNNAQPTPYENTPITFKHLLTHQSGVPHVSELWNADKLNMSFCPGTQVQYSSQGFGILGDIMNEITGKPYEQLVREYIAEPVGATSFTTGQTFRAPGVAVKSTIHDMALFALGVMNERYISGTLMQQHLFKKYAENEWGDISLGWFCSNIYSSDLTLFHAGNTGYSRANLNIKPFKGIGIAVTGMVKSKDSDLDLPELTDNVSQLLERD